MKIEFDPVKSEKNKNQRELPFDKASEFDWENAVYLEDERNPYPERRFIAVGYLEHRLYVLCFTPIPDGVRIISFRKANEREAKRYGKTITLD
nr:BrnT family toxin [uncultured Desulfobulbus sp.]